MAEWEGVNDVEALKSMLAAQQEQLQQMEKQHQQPSAVTHNTRKKRVKVYQEDDSDYISDGSEPEVTMPYERLRLTS